MQYEHMMITTNRTFAEWSSVFGDAEMATALPDRLAASRPHMNFVPPRALAQQDMLCVDRLRKGFKEERVACISRISGLLAEFSVVLPQSAQHRMTKVKNSAALQETTLERCIL